jgi:cell wall-associated NlpC family hydrolase
MLFMRFMRHPIVLKLLISCVVVSTLAVPLVITVSRAHAVHASGGITFDNSPGSAAPPSTLGPYSMTPFPADPQSFGNVSSVAAPGSGDVTFAPDLNHLRIGQGWATWSNGYTGDVYWTNGGTSATMTMPLGTSAFYFYAEPNPFAVFNITATTQNGTSSGPIPVNGFSGARYFGFYTDGSTTLETISISSDADFAVGEFGISTASALGAVAAQLAKSVVGAPYLGDGSTFGGKGYDWNSRLFVGPDQIKSGYNYYNNVDKKIEFGAGLDCAGLIFWAYNKAFGATQYLSLSNPIYYEGADGQYAFNSKPISKADLQPGDLLFFSNDGGKSMHHVAMYVGGDDAVEAANTSIGIVLSKVSEMITRTDFFSYGRPTPPVVAGQIRAHSPISLVVTDPDGYTINDQTAIVTDEERLREVPRQLYYSEWNIDQSGRVDDIVTFPTLKTGNYFIKVVPKPGAMPTDVYSLDIEVAGQTITLANNVPLKDIPSQGYGIKSTGGGISVFIPVSIDIKPGSSDNSINPSSNGKIPVAILSSTTFNAPATVDKTSLTFGHTGNENSLAFCNVEDVNGDGLLDLICQFNTQQTGFNTGDMQGILNGKTTSGIPIRGADSVRIVP